MVCDEFEISGCTDATACNYDALATDDDGTCYNNDLGCGCDTPAAVSGYDCDGVCLIDTDGDGVCDEFETLGCTDNSMFNYNSLATDDDNSCIPFISGCMDDNYVEYNSSANTSDGTCLT